MDQTGAERILRWSRDPIDAPGPGPNDTWIVRYAKLRYAAEMTGVSLRSMNIDDYDAVYSLWQSTPGIGLNESDRRDAIAAFLQRNPDMSAVAVTTPGNIVGTALCGHDGRRGYLHHLAVLPAYRNHGIAKRLVAQCLARLRDERIHKCNIFLFRSNESGAAFWTHNGWTTRNDLSVLQVVLGGAD